MADRVAEVQDLPAPRVALVGGDDRELRARAGEDRLLVHLAAGRHALPQRPAGDQRRLQHLDPAGGELGAGSVASVSGSTSTPAGWW